MLFGCCKEAYLQNDEPLKAMTLCSQHSKWPSSRKTTSHDSHLRYLSTGASPLANGSSSLHYSNREVKAVQPILLGLSIKASPLGAPATEASRAFSVAPHDQISWDSGRMCIGIPSPVAEYTPARVPDTQVPWAFSLADSYLYFLDHHQISSCLLLAHVRDMHA